MSGAAASAVSFRQSIFSRLLVWAIAATLGAVLLLWTVTAVTIERTAQAAISAAVDVDLSGLADIYASGGRDELVRRLNDRLIVRQSAGTAAHYLLADNAGDRLAGDLPRWPALSAEQSEAGELALTDGSGWARATRLGPEDRLLVMRETGDTRALQHSVALVFTGVGGAVVALVALASGILARRLDRRLARVNAAFDDPGPDALRALATAETGHDEIARLARHTGTALERQHRLMEAHRDTAAHLAHEVRTPLMHLDNRLQHVLRGAPDAGSREPLDLARGDIRRIIVLLESLLDIAASEVRRGDSHGLPPVHLSALVERLADLYAASAEDSGHGFTTDIAPGVTLPGEEPQLARLVTNLLDNAFKYVPAGGTVHLSLQPGPVLTVADDGPGIAAADRERIFDRFARGSGAQGDGAGLGLALCRAIAGRHGLALTLEPSETGARFVAAPLEGA